MPTVRPFFGDAIVRIGRVHGAWQVDVLRREAVLVLEHSARRALHVVDIPGERDFPAPFLAGVAFECRTTNEVVIELDERPVAEVRGRQVVVLDPVGDEAAADRTSQLRRHRLAATLDRPACRRRCTRPGAATGSIQIQRCCSSRCGRPRHGGRSRGRLRESPRGLRRLQPTVPSVPIRAVPPCHGAMHARGSCR